ncbi:unnamed protein product [Dovyalis caffra]|uniref:Uncharacterized protein n=1 Tax=Dovyalis caffra TaxID=77055 RepID=A0AAV1SRZ2_9ROSI|nr:unnamed protein product [Dovyalis caffra]
MYKSKARELEEDVRCIISNGDMELLAILEMIDDIQRLGLGHRFEEDIKRKLDRISSSEQSNFDADQSLHATALCFRLLRQHGYEVSQDVFESFVDDDGNVKACVHKDIKGLLSLYEATHLAHEGENLLDKALAQTSIHLKNLPRNIGYLGNIEDVHHALELPLNRRMLMLEARQHIEAYNKKEDANHKLLELAKLDFNMVQSVLLRDLQNMSRWDVAAVRNLPDYMKLCFLALYNTVNEMAYDHLNEKGDDIIPYLAKAWADLCKAFLQEAKWTYNRSTPSYKDYLENGWRSVSGTVLLVHAYFLLGQNISEDALDCLINYHEFLRWPSIIFRLCNDLGSSSAEVMRGETTNAISCYIQETGVSEKEARDHINKLIDETWKKMNKYEFDKSIPFAKPFMKTAINLARISHCTYQHGDSHGAPDARSKDRIMSLIIEPIAIMDR